MHQPPRRRTRPPAPVLFAAGALVIAGLLLAIAAAAQQQMTSIRVSEVAAGTSDVQAVAARPKDSQGRGGQQLVCISVTETGDADDATVAVHIGTSSAGPRAMSDITVLPHESTLRCFEQDRGPDVSAGVFLNRTGPGTALVVVQTRPF